MTSINYRRRETRRILFVKALEQADTTNSHDLQSKHEDLKLKQQELLELNDAIIEEMLTRDPPATDEEIAVELEGIANDNEMVRKSIRELEKHLRSPVIETPTTNPVQTQNEVPRARGYKLPKIELYKFNGELKEWIPFWCLFKKIDNDNSLSDEDKFQYLLQSMTPGTRARKVVESYPPAGPNYRKALEALKSRFGREDVLIDYYIRQLMNLTLSLSKSESRPDTLVDVYDLVETQLNSLETLGITTSAFALALFPLVESCLSAEQSRAWQRSEQTEVISPTDKLRSLMRFLEKEVRIEESIRNKAQVFSGDERGKCKVRMSTEPAKVPTAAELVARSEPFANKCVFCDGNHANHLCKRAERMTLQDRTEVLKTARCCFKCMKSRPSHTAIQCRAQLRCGVCSNRHATLMCWKRESEPLVDKNLASTSDIVATDVQACKEANLACTSMDVVYLQTLQVLARGCDGTEMKIRVLFDSGSQHSYIRKAIAKSLGYRAIGGVQLLHTLFGGTQTGMQMHNKYKVYLGSMNGDYLCNFDVLDQESICSNVPSYNRRNVGGISDELERLGIELTPDVNTPIDLLVGADVYGKLLTGRREVLKCGLVAFNTNLGWIVSGKISNQKDDDKKDETENVMVATTMLSMVNLDSISNLWELEVLGIQDPYQKKSKEMRAEEAHKFFLDTVSRNNDGRYEVRLPWVEDHAPIPRNFLLAKRRLDRTIMKLNEVNLQESYGNLFKEWLDEGFLETVDFKFWDQGHYLPHRPVFKDSKTTPVRPVFDASAQEKGYPSLNQCLEKGINLIERIPKLLLMFRLNRIGVTSDIRKAFQQISLVEEDRNYLRFLWVQGDGTLMIYRHARVVFGVTSSPYLLGATIDYHLWSLLGSKRYEDELIQRLRKSFYVDNCITSVKCEEELEQYKENAIAIFLEAKMDLRCWEYTDPSIESDSLTHVLGLLWDRQLDFLAVNPASWKVVDTTRITRKTLMSVAHRVFDPIGFCCPTTLLPKLLLQQCSGGNWQEEIPKQLQGEFFKWYQELIYLESIKIPRWIAVGSDGEVIERSVHTFCDASKIAYSAVVFLRTVTNQGVHVHLIQAKSRLAPSSDVTIPRLELLAALIGSRLTSSAREVFGDEIKFTYWTDSSTVLAWINRDDNWGVFLRNRVDEIRSVTRKEDWRHVPGVLNPADLPSRGCSPKALLESKWWEGPAWLREEEGQWPMETVIINEEEVESEKKKKGANSLVLFDSTENTLWFQDLVSGYEGTVRLVGWVLRFTQNCLTKKPVRGELLCKEVVEAEKFIWKAVQRNSFKSVLDPSILPLVAFEDEEGLIRVKTKVTARKDSYDFRFPVLIPSDQVMVEKLVLQEHQRSCHVGVQGLLSILRDRFWIIRGRKTVRTILNKCTNCIRYSARHSEALNPPLPEARVRDAEVFEVSGVDFFGPLFLKDGRKVYVVIFTCAVYRAVHLELAVSLSTGTLIQVLRRFIARRGRPSIMYSDNARNFVGADSAFKRLDWDKLTKFYATERIEWRFNPPSSPWWGGWWERLIAMIKQMLRRTLGKAAVTYEELETLLCDCEATMNDRPLTYVSEDCEDLVAITPNMFLRGIKQSGVVDCDLVSSSILGDRARYIQKIRMDLRARFRNEYLGRLARVAKRSTRTLRIGELVLIGSEDKKRIDWPLARIVGFIKGNDGENRVVKLATAAGEVTRPLQRIYPLEVGLDQTDDGRRPTSGGGVCEE